MCSHFKLRIIVANTTVWARDQWSRSRPTGRPGCLIRIYCVSRSWTALISGCYGGRPASAAYVLNFVCTFKPASLDPLPTLPSFHPSAVRLQKSRSRRAGQRRRMRARMPAAAACACQGLALIEIANENLFLLRSPPLELPQLPCLHPMLV